MKLKVIEKSVRCPIYTNITITKMGLCKRYSYCEYRGSLRCPAIGQK